jgi:small subunit ribosomal protein S23
MGRYDLRPAKVLEAANRLIAAKKDVPRPPWHEALTKIPPGEVLFRPVQRFADVKRSRKGKKPSRMFQPLPLAYPEDKLRTVFFNDHPWELARPRVVLEDSGNDSKHWDWTRIEQLGKRVDGERYCNLVVARHS